MSRKHKYKKQVTAEKINGIDFSKSIVADAVAQKLFAHKCIRCKTEYQSETDDAYLCNDCNTNRMAIAREIDAKIKTVGQVPNGDWTLLDKTGTMDMGNGSKIFVMAKR